MELWLDDRTISIKEERRAMGIQARLPKIAADINECRRLGDNTYRHALIEWRASVAPRVAENRPFQLKLPELLQKALGLLTQEVILDEKNQIWQCLNGQKFRLLLD